jgi:hypothetical protein
MSDEIHRGRRLALTPAPYSGSAALSSRTRSCCEAGKTVAAGGGPAEDLKAAGRFLGLEVVVLPGSNEREIDESFAAMAERSIGALVVTADGFLISRRNQIIKLAARYVMPAMFPLSQYRRGRTTELWRESSRRIFANWHLRRKYSQGCTARRPASSTA